ncbi:MAG: glycosyltransferase family 4 protein [Gemmatimonadetes bacterium]|nr:glycosyltransferase family 4 protein [Gemmatimonadota bacterium]
MKVLLVHNFYQQPGGEDQVFEAEGALLEQHGDQVIRYTVHNDQISRMNQAEILATTLWNRGTLRDVGDLLRKEGPQVVHVHNTFPLISPSVYSAAAAAGVRVVHTLHNYRLLCPMAEFFRDGKVCEDCLGRVPWPGIVHACYRGSRVASGTVATMLTVHRLLGTWQRKVSVYIALTDFARKKFIEGGLPADRLVVKPNFVEPDPGAGEGRGGYALFVGRLAASKGVETMLEAWERVWTRAGTPLWIVGDGPLRDRVQASAGRLEGVRWLGRRSREEVLEFMRDAVLLIFPSEWYEGLPVVILEAYATGLPVVASDLGSMATIVENGRTGIHFQPGNAADLAEKVAAILSQPAAVAVMRKEARLEFEARYTANRNYDQLMRIYSGPGD